VTRKTGINNTQRNSHSSISPRHSQEIIPPKAIVKTNIKADEANALVKEVKFC
jgi:hypothetical protein